MAKPVTVTIPHELGRIEARRRIDEGVGRLTAQLGAGASSLTREWDGDTLNFGLQAMGQRITGVIDVADQAVRIDLVLPNLLAMVAGKLKGKVQNEGQLLLEKKRS